MKSAPSLTSWPFRTTESSHSRHSPCSRSGGSIGSRRTTGPGSAITTRAFSGASMKGRRSGGGPSPSQITSTTGPPSSGLGAGPDLDLGGGRCRRRGYRRDRRDLGGGDLAGDLGCGRGRRHRRCGRRCGLARGRRRPGSTRRQGRQWHRGGRDLGAGRRRRTGGIGLAQCRRSAGRRYGCQGREPRQIGQRIAARAGVRPGTGPESFGAGPQGRQQERGPAPNRGCRRSPRARQGWSRP